MQKPGISRVLFLQGRPFAVTSLSLLRIMPRHLLITHQGTHINSKLLAHLATNNNIEFGHRAN